jgi:ABC-type sugar transport system substrate-binding protein
MKRILALVICLLMISTTLIACSSAPKGETEKPSKSESADSAKASGTSSDSEAVSDASKTVRFTFVTPLLSHPVWLGAKDGIEAAAKDFPGLEVSWVGPMGLDANEMIKQIEIAMAEKVDGIAAFGLSEEAMEPVFKKVHESGIRLYTAGGDTPNLHQYLTGGASADPINWGYNGGKKVSEALQGKKIIAAKILYAIDSSLALDIMVGYEKAFQEHDAGFEWVATVESKSDSLVAAQRAQEIFTTYPDLNAFVCCGGECGGAIAQVMKEMGKDPKELIVLGDGVMEDCVAAIKDGYVYGTIGQNYFQYGYRPAMWTYMSAMFGIEPEGDPFKDTGTTYVDANNVDTFDENFTDGSQWFKVDYPNEEWPVTVK